MAKSGMKCGETAALLAEMIQTAAGVPGINTMEQAVAYLNKRIDAGLTTELAFDEMAKWVLFRRADRQKRVLSGIEQITRETGIFTKLKSSLKDLRQGIVSGQFASTPEKFDRKVSKVIKEMRAEQAKLEGIKRQQELLDKAAQKLEDGDLSTKSIDSKALSHREQILKDQRKSKQKQLDQVRRNDRRIDKLLDDVRDLERGVDLEIKAKKVSVEPKVLNRLRQRKSQLLAKRRKLERAKKASEINAKRAAKELQTVNDNIVKLKDDIRRGDFSTNKKDGKKRSKEFEKRKRIEKELARIKTLMGQIEKMKGQLESGLVFPSKAEVRKRSFLLKKVEAERDALKGKIDQKRKELVHKPGLWDVWDSIGSTLKPIQASVDASFMLIQGPLVAASRPIQFVRDSLTGLGSIPSGKLADAVDTAIDNDPLMRVLEEAAPNMLPKPHEIADGVELRESILERMPVAGRGFKAMREYLMDPSGRGWIAAVKSYRFNMFKGLANGWIVGGNPTVAEAELLAGMVGATTGAGGPVGKKGRAKTENAMRLLNRAVFSAQSLLAAAKFVTLQPVWRGLDLMALAKQPVSFWKNNPTALPRARAAILAEYGRMYLGMAALAALWEAGGGDEVEKVPWEKDFMVLKTDGGTRFTVASPVATTSRFISSLKSGAMAIADQTITREEAEFDDDDRKPLTSFGMARIAEGKASPVLNILLSIFKAEDYMGDMTTADRIFLESITPISTQGIIEDMEGKDAPEYLLKTGIKLLGGNIRDDD